VAVLVVVTQVMISNNMTLIVLPIKTLRNIVAVLHGGSIRAILASILGTPPVASLSFDVAPLAITRVDYLDAPDNPGWRIGSVNLML